MPPAPENTDFARFFNQGEAVLWFVIAVVLLFRLKPPQRLAVLPWRWLLPLAFAVFGVSDVIESHTGAWWEPWWLLVMKAACVLCFIGAWWHQRRK